MLWCTGILIGLKELEPIGQEIDQIFGEPTKERLTGTELTDAELEAEFPRMSALDVVLTPSKETKVQGDFNIALADRIIQAQATEAPLQLEVQESTAAVGGAGVLHSRIAELQTEIRLAAEGLTVWGTLHNSSVLHCRITELQTELRQAQAEQSEQQTRIDVVFKGQETKDREGITSALDVVLAGSKAESEAYPIYNSI